MDKLSLINDALLNTANDPINTLYDGSDEWRYANAAFNSAVKYVMAFHNWTFAKGAADLARVGDSEDPDYSDAFAIPVNAWHILDVGKRINGDTCSIDYSLFANTIVCNEPGSLTCTFLRHPADDDISPAAEIALQTLVESYLYRSFNEDDSNADRRMRDAGEMLQRAATRNAQQSPGRRALKSDARAARRMRKA